MPDRALGFTTQALVLQPALGCTTQALLLQPVLGCTTQALVLQPALGCTMQALVLQPALGFRVLGFKVEGGCRATGLRVTTLTRPPVSAHGTSQQPHTAYGSQWRRRQAP